MDQLDITSHDADGWTVIAVAGEVDLASAPDLQRSVEDALAAGAQRLILDLRSVTFMDSTGLRVLLTTHQRLQESGGSLALVAAEGPVTRLMSLTGVDQRIPVAATVETVTSGG